MDNRYILVFRLFSEDALSEGEKAQKMQIVFCIIVLVAILTAWVAMRVGHLPNDETSVFVIVLFATLLGVSLSSAQAALIILYADFVLPTQKVSGIYACLFLAPMLSFGIAWLIGKATYKRLLRDATADRKKVPAGDFFQNLKEEMCQQMQVPSNVKLLWLKRRSFSPVAFALSRKEPVILLPWNLWEVAEIACQGDRTLTKNLLRLVMAHEIAHVRNGDVVYVPFLSAVAGVVMWAFLAVVTLCWLASQIRANETLVILEPRLMSVLITGFIFLISLVWFTITRREHLADQTARKLTPPEWINRLTEENTSAGREISPLERFVVLVSSINACSRSVMGFSLKTPINKFMSRIGWNSVTAFRTRMGWRIHAFKMSESHAMRERKFQIWTIVLTAFLGAFLFAIFEAATLQDFEFFWLRQYSQNGVPLQNSFLHAIDGWSQLQKESLTARITSSLGPFTIALAMTVIFSRTIRWPRLEWSLRESIRVPLGIVGWVIAMCFCFLFMRGLLEVQAIPTVPNFEFLRPSSLELCFWLIFTNVVRVIWLVWKSENWYADLHNF